MKMLTNLKGKCGLDTDLDTNFVTTHFLQGTF